MLYSSKFQPAPSHRMQVITRHATVVGIKSTSGNVAGFGFRIGRAACRESDTPEGSRWSRLEIFR